MQLRSPRATWTRNVERWRVGRATFKRPGTMPGMVCQTMAPQTHLLLILRTIWSALGVPNRSPSCKRSARPPQPHVRLGGKRTGALEALPQAHTWRATWVRHAERHEGHRRPHDLRRQGRVLVRPTATSPPSAHPKKLHHNEDRESCEHHHRDGARPSIDISEVKLEPTWRRMYPEREREREIIPKKQKRNMPLHQGV